AVGMAGDRGVDGLDLRFLAGRGGDGVGERFAARFSQELGERAHFEALLAARPAEDAAERGVGAYDPAGAVERGDREGRIVEEARETDLGGAQFLFGAGGG